MKKSSVLRTVKEECRTYLIVEKLPGYFLIACVIAALIFFLEVISPFLTVTLIGAVLVIAFYPLYKWILKLFRGWARTASLVSCLLVVFVIIVPLAFFVVLIAGEAFDTYQVVQAKIESGMFDKYLQWKDGGFFYDLKQSIDPVINLDGLDIKKNIIDMAQALSSFLVSQTASFVASFFEIVLGIIVMIFVMFYFFKDGPSIVKRIGHLSPLPTVYESELFAKIASMVKAVVFGVFLTAIIQGIVGGLGFAIVGISNPVFWAAAIAFFSLFPVVGTAIIWFPASVILAIMGEYGGAIFIFLWGMFVVGTIDNFVRPYLIGGKAKTYPLLTFLAVLGGVMTMDLKGLVIGPLVLIVLLSFLHIYESEYAKVLKG